MVYLKKHKWLVFTILLIVIYSIYFSYFTILRNRTLYSSYFDMGIMHQTVFNTYKAISTLDFSRVFELTNPFGPEQIKRMAIHNDFTLGLFSLFYFFHSGPETLLVLQSIILALGAFFVYRLTQVILPKVKGVHFLSFSLATSYLLFTPMERANIFDFHAVTLATTFLLGMLYFWLVKKYYWSFIFFCLSLFSKEQIALTLIYFSLYILWLQWKSKEKNRNEVYFGILLGGVSVLWFLLCIFIITPYLSGGHHFALQYYGDFGDSPFKILVGIIQNPASLVKYIWRTDTARYFWFLLGPLGLTSLLSPIQLLIALPEFAINLLSNNFNMRNIIFHYTAVIQPFVFFSAIYGVKKIMKKLRAEQIAISLLLVAIVFSYFKGPLPYSREREIHPFKYPQSSLDVVFWEEILKNESIKVSSTSQLAPHFTSRRYFYLFSPWYELADYVVLRRSEIYNYPDKAVLIPLYEKLKKDSQFQKIYQKDDLEVFKKKIYDLNHYSRV